MKPLPAIILTLALGACTMPADPVAEIEPTGPTTSQLTADLEAAQATVRACRIALDGFKRANVRTAQALSELLEFNFDIGSKIEGATDIIDSIDTERFRCMNGTTHG